MHLTPDEIASIRALLRQQGREYYAPQAPAPEPRPRTSPLWSFVTLVVVGVMLLLAADHLFPGSVAALVARIAPGATTAVNGTPVVPLPTAAVTAAPVASQVVVREVPVAQQPAYAPAPPPQATNAPITIVETATPMEPTTPPLPTADVASASDVDALANAVDLASGGNPLAATLVSPGAELPTVVIGPVDPSGGDAAMLARACANSGAPSACSAPAAAVDEARLGCALDLAYGGVGCTPESGVSVQAHVGSDGARVSVGVGK